MKFFFDNNLSPRLVRGLLEFGEDVTHLRDQYPADVPDQDWLPDIGAKGWVLVTRDERVRRNPSELAAINIHKVGAFFLGGKNLSHWELIQQVVRNWIRMKELADKTAKPFAFRVAPHGSTLDRIPL